MHLHRPALRPLETLAIVAIALGFFLALYDVSLLDPTHYVWMLDGDAAQHFLGWRFFVSEPWTWPPGRIAGYGYPGGTSIVFTDSIPLLALLFKPLAPWLPPGWHYFGFWMLATYMLNGWFGLRLAARLTDQPVSRVLAACFFIVAPPVILRSGGHEALMAHWIVLAGIGECLSNWSARRWLLLCVVAALVHPYLLLMSLGLMLAAAVTQWWTHRGRLPLGLLGQVLGIVAATVLVMGLAGYFSGSGSVASGGFGYYSMNLNAYIDPWFDWSRFLRQRPVGTAGQYEGFMYLGVGMIALSLAAAAVWVAQPSPLPRRQWPLLAAALLFAAWAVSNVVMWGDTELARLPLPHPLEQALGVFRASGRLGWVLYYLVCLFVLWAILHYMSPVAAPVILALALVLQVYDQSGKFPEYRKAFAKRSQWVTPLRSAQWQDLAQRAKALVIVPPHEPMERLYAPYALLASQHGLATNAAHIARTDGVQDASGRAAAEALRLGRPDPGILYVLPDPEARDHVAQTLRPQLQALNGVWVLPPQAGPVPRRVPAKNPQTPVGSVGM